jgi:hypothetical protein
MKKSNGSKLFANCHNAICKRNSLAPTISTIALYTQDFLGSTAALRIRIIIDKLAYGERSIHIYAQDKYSRQYWGHSSNLSLDLARTNTHRSL